MIKRWVTIFKALGNVNRVKTIRMLASGKKLSVTEIAEELGIAIKSTSKHLIILHNLEVLDSEGKRGHVYYNLNKNLPPDLMRAIKLFC